MVGKRDGGEVLDPAEETGRGGLVGGVCGGGGRKGEGGYREMVVARRMVEGEGMLG